MERDVKPLFKIKLFSVSDYLPVFSYDRVTYFISGYVKDTLAVRKYESLTRFYDTGSFSSTVVHPLSKAPWRHSFYVLEIATRTYRAAHNCLANYLEKIGGEKKRFDASRD